MGTNYFRIPKISNRVFLVEKLQKDFFEIIEKIKSDRFSTQNLQQISSLTEGCVHELKVHVGKKSVGWNFTFNYNEGLYYKNTKELAEFVKSGIIINEYDEIVSTDEFLGIALAQNSSFKRQRNYDDSCFVIDGYDFLDTYFR